MYPYPPQYGVQQQGAYGAESYDIYSQPMPQGAYMPAAPQTGAGSLSYMMGGALGGFGMAPMMQQQPMMMQQQPMMMQQTVMAPVGPPAMSPAAAAMNTCAIMGATAYQFTANGDADRLYYSMAGMGTDDRELIEILGGRPREHLVMVAQVYQQRYGKSLASDIRGDTSFSYKQLCINLIKPYGEFLADCIYESIVGLGTKENELIDIVTQISPAELALLNQTWQQKYGHSHGSLEHVISGDTSFNFRKTLMHTIRGTRMPPGQVDPTRVEAEAHALYHAGEHRLGTNEGVFIDIISRSSAEHLQLVSQAYARHHHHSLEKAIEKETSGDFCTTLIALCTPRPTFVARRVNDAIRGLGTNDSLLVRMFSFNNKPLLHMAAAEYQRMYGHSMEQAVCSDTSGPYRDLLVRLLRP
eukprot:TRINITY_DN17637_c0_g1_i1.p1 TRINITY_DN17637_c0_g1~~TRINITY_DN17637_c0_g1_i1.p1  ORF type:complete len:413 (-),score=118.00 TRINITY_DN17637_c0_g1_i1:81-1319(-)